MKFELIPLWWVFFCAIDVLMCGRFFHAMFKRHLNRVYYTICTLIVTMMIVVVNSFGSIWLNLLLTPILYMTIAVLAYRVSISNYIGYTIIYYVIFAGGKEILFEILYRFLVVTFDHPILAWFIPGGIPFLLLEYMLEYLLLLYIEKYLKKLDINGSDRFCWYQLIMPIASLLIMTGFGYIEFPSSRLLQIIICGGTLLLYFSNAAVFVVLAGLTQTMNQIKLTELANLKRDLERSNFDRIDRVNEVNRKFLHDIHQYFYQFRNLAVQGETKIIVGIIDELEGKLRAEECKERYVSDPVLNSVLVEYDKQAKEQGIDITIHAEEGLNVSFLSDGDKISIFGNLLSNALEAAAKCEEGRRSIYVELFMGNRHMLVFRVENTHTNDFKKERESLLSTKGDAGNHGLGIGIVRELAEKYGGNLTLAQDEEKFTAVLLVSCHTGL